MTYCYIGLYTVGYQLAGVITSLRWAVSTSWTDGFHSDTIAIF